MMKKRLALLAVAAMLFIGGVAYASIPGPDGVVHACYKNSSPAQGALIAIDSAASCPSGYTALNWNQTGPQGPIGPEGPAGPAGGFSGYELIRQITHISSGTNYWRVNCSSLNKRVLGGGAEPSYPATILTSYPVDADIPGGIPAAWIFVINTPNSDTQMALSATCADIAS